jgi:hypothetical protein
MTTRTKLNIAVFTSSVVMMLTVFSKPLHVPESIQWALMIGVFIPLGLMFYFIRKLKQEKLMRPGITTDAPEKMIRKRTRNRLILMMGSVCVLGLCAPFWLPLTGTTLGPRGDFVVGLITIAIVCTIFGFRLRKL